MKLSVRGKNNSLSQKLTNQVIQSSPFSRRMTLVFLLVLLTVFFFDRYVQPHIQSISAAQSNIQLKQQMGQKIKGIQRMMVLGKRKITELESEVGELQKQFFGVNEVSAFFGSLEEMAEKNTCLLESMNFLSNTKEQSAEFPLIEPKTAGLSLYAEYKNLTAFIDCFEQIPQNVTINRIGIEKLETDQSVLRCHMEITVYTLKTDQAIYDKLINYMEAKEAENDEE